MKHSLTQQRGAALLSALLLMALAAAIATWCYVQQHLWLQQAQWLLQADRMDAALEEARAWALQVVVTPSEARTLPAYHRRWQGMQLDASVVSESGRFNINALQSSEQVLHFVFLLQALDTKLTTSRAIRIAYDVNAWLSPTARLERYYLGLKPPYRQGHRLMAQWNELRAVRGIDPARYHQLVQGPVRYLTALPTQGLVIDVNEVSAPVLASVTSLSNEEANQVIRCRDAAPRFRSLDDFMARCGRDLHIETVSLGVSSSFYLFQAHARHGSAQQMLTALLQRVETERGPVAKIVWQEWNDV